MIFRHPENVLIFGGARLVAEFSSFMSDEKYNVIVFTDPRHIDEQVYNTGTTLRDILDQKNIKYYITQDINKLPELYNYINEHAIGIGIGEAWSFPIKIIEKFNGKLLDFMGIRLPQYRGGAHYTWQILRKNRIGCCNLQIINEEMVQGKFDSGEIIKTKEYLFPTTARIPEDYFKFAVEMEIEFLKEFLLEIKEGKDFELTKIQENFSIFFPRLYTKRHAFINWNWNTEDIESFICAFDDPYSGAISFIKQQKVILKKCRVEYNDGPFHPFQIGLVFKIYNGVVYIATKNGTVLLEEIFDEEGKNIKKNLKIGDRLYTPNQYIEEAMITSVDYSPEGLI